MGIKRDSYLNKLISKAENGKIKVVAGLRRSGKSFLLNRIYRDHLISHGVDESQIISFSLDKKKDAKYRNPLALSAAIEERSRMVSGIAYVFIDEIQMCLPCPDPDNPGAYITFNDVLSDYYDDPHYDVYVSGSSSRMLSKDIITEFADRGDIIEMRPLSFSEFFAFRGGDPYAAYREYFTFGGMPYAVAGCRNEKEKIDYLSRLFEETYLKDIQAHIHAERGDVLREMILDLCSSVGSLTNPSKIARTLHSTKGVRVTDDTIVSYLSGAVDSFLFAQALRYDVKGKRYFNYPSKYYCADLGLRNCWLNLRQQEETHIMENIIFNELCFRGFTPDVGVVESFSKNDDGKTVRIKTEIDFVINAPEGRFYIQSALDLSSPEKKETELRPFKGLTDFRKKIVIDRHTPRPYVDESGALYCSIVDFLLDENLMN